MSTDFRSKGNNEAKTPKVFSSAAIPPIYAKVVFPIKSHDEEVNIHRICCIFSWAFESGSSVISQKKEYKEFLHRFFTDKMWKRLFNDSVSTDR
jgi:hypothetical protein